MLINRYNLMEEEGGGEAAGGGATITESAAPAAETPAAPESGTVLDGGADGDGGSVAPADKLFGKYDDMSAAEKGYTEMQSLQTKTKESLNAANEKLKGFVGAPENGEYTLPDGASGFSETVLSAISEVGNEVGLSQDAYGQVLSKIAEAEATDLAAYKIEQMGLLGNNAQTRIQNINDEWAAKFGGEALEWMNTKASSAADVEMFESLLASMGGSTVNPSGTQAMGEVKITREQLSEAMMKTDENGNLKRGYDMEYKGTVDAMIEKYNKQQGI